MLDSAERTGIIRLITSGLISITSLWGLLLFGFLPQVCGAGFIAGAMLCFAGHIRLSKFYPFRDDRVMGGILYALDLMNLVAAVFGLLLLEGKI